jgi:perosamine synthetase
MGKEKLALYGGHPARPYPGPEIEPKWAGEEMHEIIDVFEAGIYSRNHGTKVRRFESEFAAAFGVKYAIAVTSGTAAIHVAVGALQRERGWDVGDEIISSPLTDIGSVVPIVYQGLIPVFADSDPETFCISASSIEAKISPRTRAILVVHLFGNPADMHSILELAKRRNLDVIEDCAQAHYSAVGDHICGTLGTCGAFSLQAGKLISVGEGGMMITPDEELAQQARLFSDKGWTRQKGFGPGTYHFLAPSYRMSELEGAVGCAQIRKLPDIAKRRNHNGTALTTMLANIEFVQPQRVLPGHRHTYWMYAFVLKPEAPYNAVRFAEALEAEGVYARARYTTTPVFRCADWLETKTTFGTSGWPFTSKGAANIRYDENTSPVSADILSRLVVVKISETMTERDIEEIANAIKKVAKLLPPDSES